MRRWLIAIAFLFSSAYSAYATATSLTGLVVVASDSTGNDPGSGGGIWSTSNENWWKLWINKGGPDGDFINGPDDAHAGINILMENGSHTFTIRAAGQYNGFDTFAFNMFFNGQTAATQISAYAPLHQGGGIPAFHVNTSPQTSGMDLDFMPAAGTLLYSDGSTTVTLTDFSWSRPEVFAEDRISPLSTSPDGQSEFVGHFSILVTGVVPEPGSLGLLSAGFLVLLAVRLRRRIASRFGNVSTNSLLLIAAIIASCASSAAAAPIQWPAADGGNDHWYELVETPVSWEQAFADAQLRTPPVGYKAGHLVTVSSAAENDFLAASFVTEFRVGAWAGFTDAEVEGEWRWIDDTPGIWQDPAIFSNPIQTAYTNWIPGEPNDLGDEDYLLISFEAGYFPGQWNDGRGPGLGQGILACIYVVEYEPIPEPATRTLAAIAALLLVVQRLLPRYFCRSSFALAFLACLALVPVAASAKPPRGGYGGIPARYGPEWRAQQAGTYTQVWVNSPYIGSIQYGTQTGGFNRWGGVGPGWRSSYWGGPWVQPMPMFWGPTYFVPQYNWPTYQYYIYY